jgi:uncharacterized membrane protein
VRPSRRAYVDWLRGVAVISMIEWHVLDAWTSTAVRGSTIWLTIQIIGGFAAPLFLFLAGVAVPFAIQAQISKGADPRRAAWLVQRRGWQVFGIAHLFRLQSFLFNPNGKWSGILRPDILNILGLGLAGTSWLVGRGGAPRRRFWWLIAPAVAIVVLTPMAPHWWWPTLLAHIHPRLEAYIRPVNGLGVFTLFPWVAFVPFGAFIGLLMAESADDAAAARLHRWFAIAGIIVAAIGFGIGTIEVPRIAFWTKPWSMFLAQAGLMTAALSGARAFMKLSTSGALAAMAAPIIRFGRTSLFVYWVHVELAYGFLSYPLHYALPLPWSMAGLGVMFVVMYYAAGWWESRPERPWIPDQLRANESTDLT